MAEAHVLSLKISKNIKTSKNEEQALCENYLYYKKRYNEKVKLHIGNVQSRDVMGPLLL